MADEQYDLIVIGGGPGGLATVRLATDLGLSCVLVHQRKLGGDDLYFGSIPRATLAASAKQVYEMARGNVFGHDRYQVPIHFDRIMEQVRDRVGTIAHQMNPAVLESRGVRVIAGEAVFQDPNAVLINGQIIRGRKFVIAAGSTPILPDIPGLNASNCLTAEKIFLLQHVPASLVVSGIDYWTLEVAQIFRRLGSTVTLVVPGASLLPDLDPAVHEIITHQFEKEGIMISTESAIHGVTAHGPETVVTIDSPRGNHEVRATTLVVAHGWKANTSGLKLEAAGVTIDNGAIAVDKNLRTNAHHIYVCGGLAGGRKPVHHIEAQAAAIVRHIAFHFPVRTTREAMPQVLFTDPEVAQVGLTLAEAKKRGIACTEYRIEFGAVPRAVAESASDGFVSVVLSQKGKVLGATIVGRHAGELIHEYALCIGSKISFQELTRMAHVYPTYSTSVGRLGERYRSERMSRPIIRKIASVLKKL